MLSNWDKSVFTTNAVDGKPLAHDVYTKGSGPVVLVIQELPGIGVETKRLAEDLIAAGFTVVMPHLFGPIGKLSFAGNIARVFCMRREFAVFAKNRTSPVVRWLRALAAEVKAAHKVEGIGVIGMCLTGNFAISMMADESVLAAVASQPSLPILANSALHMSAQDVDDIRTGLDEKGPMLAFRFQGDKLCTHAKFEALGTAFNGDKERIELREIEGEKHSLLTVHFNGEDGTPTSEALKEVLSYFQETLSKA